MKNTKEQDFYAACYALAFQSAKPDTDSAKNRNKIAMNQAKISLAEYRELFPKKQKQSDHVFPALKAFEEIAKLFPDINPHYFDGVSNLYTSEAPESLFNKIKELINTDRNFRNLIENDKIALNGLRKLFPSQPNVDATLQTISALLEDHKYLQGQVEVLKSKQIKPKEPFDIEKVQNWGGQEVPVIDKEKSGLKNKFFKKPPLGKRIPEEVLAPEYPNGDDLSGIFIDLPEVDSLSKTAELNDETGYISAIDEADAVDMRECNNSDR